jgi:hypothetical protein
MLLCYYYATMLLCYYATMLLCYYATMLLCYYATTLLCYYATMLLWYCTTMLLLCFYATMLLLCYYYYASKVAGMMHTIDATVRSHSGTTSSVHVGLSIIPPSPHVAVLPPPSRLSATTAPSDTKAFPSSVRFIPLLLFSAPSIVRNIKLPTALIPIACRCAISFEVDSTPMLFVTSNGPTKPDSSSVTLSLSTVVPLTSPNTHLPSWVSPQLAYPEVSSTWKTVELLTTLPSHAPVLISKGPPLIANLQP